MAGWEIAFINGMVYSKWVVELENHRTQHRFSSKPCLISRGYVLEWSKQSRTNSSSCGVLVPEFQMNPNVHGPLATKG